MSGKVRGKVSGNVSSQTTSINEKILKQCHLLYADPDNGLANIADSLGFSLLAPRKKITVLLIGNHSAGKSSFINWYVEEHIQKTGVAIETQGFTFVTSGRKRESLTGNATLHLYPHFEPLRQIDGVVDYLSTELSTSQQKKFSLVTFVDTPGLVDGDMKYQFDVNKAILWLGDLADLILVFFDPIGQALCKRTLNLVEKMNEKHADRIHFYLSKADEAGDECDRQRVMMQIVQELCKRPGLNRTGFEMPTVYIPTFNQKGSRCVNQIEQVCRTVEQTINHTVQNTLNHLERDSDRTLLMIEERLTADSMQASLNVRARVRSALCGLLGVLLTLLLLLTLLINLSHSLLSSLLGEDLVASFDTYIGGGVDPIPCVSTHRNSDPRSGPAQLFPPHVKQRSYPHGHPFLALWRHVPAGCSSYIIGGILLLSLLTTCFAKLTLRTQPTLSRKRKKHLMETNDYIQDVVKKKKQTLYAEYLRQYVAEHDL